MRKDANVNAGHISRTLGEAGQVLLSNRGGRKFFDGIT